MYLKEEFERYNRIFKILFIIIMEKNSLVLIIHSQCNASLSVKNKFIMNNIDVQIIDLEFQTVETQLELDLVPILVIDNNKVLKGKSVFDYLDELILNKNAPQNNGKKKSSLYSNLYIAPSDGGSKPPPVKLE